MLVLICHSFRRDYFWGVPWLDQGVLDVGQVGVSVFFVISGFVLPISLQKSYRLRDYPRFLARRFVRIEPTYLTSMVVAIAWVWIATRLAPNATPWRFDLGQIMAHLLYFVPFTDYKWVNDVYWTLAIEFQFYLFIGLAFALLRSWANRGVIFGAILSILFSCATFLHPWAEPIMLLKFAPFFGMGMLAWLVICYVVPRASWIVALCALCIVGYCGGLSVSNLIAGAVAFILIIAWNPRESWWRFFGTISYSLYVIHPPILGVEHVLGGRLIRAGYGAWLFPLPFITMAVCIAAAWVLYKLVEEPTMKLSKRIKYV